MSQAIAFLLRGIVAYGGFNGERCLGERCLQVGMHEGAEGFYMNRGGSVQPYMAIDARTLVEPAFLERSVHAHTDEIRVTVVQVFGDIERLRDVATLFTTQIKTVHPDAGVAEDAVELQLEVLAQVGFVDGEHLTIPAHRRSRILPAHGLIAVAVAGLTGEGQPDHPIMRKVDSLPARCIELHAVRPCIVNARSLREVVKILRATAEVLLRVGGMSEGKLPVVVHQLVLAVLSLYGKCSCQQQGQ